MSVDHVPVLAVAIGIGYPDFALDVRHDFALTGVTALFGPSGGGKSTLLRILAGLEPAATGRVSFDSEVWCDTAARRFVAPHRRGVGFVFQQHRLFPHLNVADNLRYADRRAPRGNGGAGYADVIAALDLKPLLARRIESLSGGESQRVAIGRTLLTRPRLLLFDEPLAALDFARKREILPYLERVLRQSNIPAIYVSHAIDEVAQLADQMVVLAGGGIAATGTTAAVLERLDVQRLTGKFEAGVLIEGCITGHDDSYKLTRVDLHGQALLMPMVELPIGDRVRLRVRARDVALATERPRAISVRNTLAGVVTEIIEEADTAFAEVFVDIGGTVLRARLTRHAVADLRLAVGSTVFALIKGVTFDRRSLVVHRREPEAGD